MPRRVFLAAITCLTLACASVVHAQARGWRNIGSLTVNRGTERDDLKVPDWRDEMRAIRIDVDRQAVQFKEIRIRYGNGQTTSINRRINVRRGNAVVVNLPGGVRDVELITFVYESIGFERGVVHVSGR
jgi:hypothetical protein